MRKEEYWNLRNHGICVWCKEPNPTPEFVKCPKCREEERNYRKKSKEFFVGLGLCSRCFKNKPELGKKQCSQCLEYENNYSATHKAVRRSTKKIEHNKIYSRNRYRELIAQGLCGLCGKRKIYKTSKARCLECLIKNKRSARVQWEKKTKIPRQDRPKYGLCYMCGEPYEPNGFKQCDNCRRRASERMKALGENNKWAKWNRKEIEKCIKIYRTKQNAKIRVSK